jgi:hypothetical protein
MSGTDVAVIALLVIVIAVLWRKDVRAAFSFLGLGSFVLEAKDVRRYSPRHRTGSRLRDGDPRAKLQDAAGSRLATSPTRQQKDD